MKCTCGQPSSKDVPRFPWYCSCGAIWESLTELREPPPPPCIHLGEPTGEVVECSNCGGLGLTVEVFHCALYGKCTLRRTKPKVGPPFDGPNCLVCRATNNGYETVSLPKDAGR